MSQFSIDELDKVLLQYYTKIELDKILLQYENKNDLASKLSDLDSGIKKFLFENQIRLGDELKRDCEDKVSNLDMKFTLYFKDLDKNLKASVAQDIESIVAKIRSDISFQVLSECKELINSFNDRSALQSVDNLRVFESKIRSEISESYGKVSQDTEKKILEFETSFQDKVLKEIQSSTLSQAENLSRQLGNSLNEQNQVIIDLLTKFRVEVQDLVSKKVIDKREIETKFGHIKEELAGKIDLAIKFQLEQTRNMMEQYAKAEISQITEDARTETMKAIFDSME